MAWEQAALHSWLAETALAVQVTHTKQEGSSPVKEELALALEPLL